MAVETESRSPLVEGDLVCGAYVLGPVVRLGAWVSVFLARRHGEEGYDYEARVVHVEPSDDPAAAAALDREALLLMELQHPSIPRVVAVGVERSEPMVISERAPGRTLRELAAEGRADLALALRVVSGVVGALDAMHGRDPAVVHRRISPEVIVVSDDHVWLDECGLAHVLTRAGWLSEDVSTVAPEYLTPEELQRHASPRSDVFALATVVFEALTGAAPFTGDTDAARSLAIMVSPRMSASEVQPDVLPELDAVFHRAWARDASASLSASDFAAAFEHALESAAQRIARERAEGLEPVARLTPLHGERAAALSSPAPAATASRPPVTSAVRPPPLPRGSTRPHGTEVPSRPSSASVVSSRPTTGSVASSRPSTGSNAAARPRAPITAELEAPVEMPSAVRTLPPSGLLKPDDPEITQRRNVAIERRESLAGPVPAASGATASTRPPERSESDRPTLPPRPKPIAQEVPMPPPVEKTSPIFSAQSARTLGVAIVLAAMIVSFSQVYIARLSAERAPVTPSTHGLSATPPPVEPPTQVTPVNLPETRRETVPSGATETLPIATTETSPDATALVVPHDAAPPPMDATAIAPVAVRPTVTLPARPSVAELARVRTQVVSAVQRCVTSPSVGPLVLVVASYAGRTGHATRVDITGRANEEPMGACIESAVMRWNLAPFAAAAWRVEYGVPIAAR